MTRIHPRKTMLRPALRALYLVVAATMLALLALAGQRAHGLSGQHASKLLDGAVARSLLYMRRARSHVSTRRMLPIMPLAGDAAAAQLAVDSLLAASATVHGSVDKAGMLPIDKWLPNSANTVADTFADWLWAHALGDDAGGLHPLALGQPPPLSARCTVLFNPLYKFIFIKNTKTAGTSLFLKFGGFCKDGITLEAARQQPPCLWKTSDMHRVGLDALGHSSWEELWRQYTVFTVARNPYDRAGSSYDYVLGRRTDNNGPCRRPSFAQFAARPYVLGLQDVAFGCGDRVHDFYHVEPQFRCLQDAQGGSVLDYVIRLESLSEDFKGLVALINRVRDPSVPALDASLGWAQKGPLAARDEGGTTGAAAAAAADEPTSRHFTKYEECGARCLEHVRAYYAPDYALFGYPDTVTSR